MRIPRGTGVILVVVLALVLVSLTGCSSSSNDIEREQQLLGTLAIVENQPVPDLHGFSLERANLIAIMLMRNQKVATFTYFFTADGRVIEICPSIGFPFPVATQLTAPEYAEYTQLALPQSEPNSLYSPDSAEGSWVLCIPDDSGQYVPTYWESRLFALPYRIESDIQLVPITAASVGIDNADLERPADIVAPDVLQTKPGVTPVNGVKVLPDPNE